MILVFRQVEPTWKVHAERKGRMLDLFRQDEHEDLFTLLLMVMRSKRIQQLGWGEGEER